MIAIILGGSPTVWAEYAEAKALLGQRRAVVVAANLAGRHSRERIDAWVSLHSDLIAGWAGRRRGNQDYRAFTPTRAGRMATEIVEERWPGSSGLYALQIALYEMGAAGAILCGVPMDSEAGHFAVPGRWASTTSYRRAFCAALPSVGARVRSMSGWTQSLFGRPDQIWIEAIEQQRSLGRTEKASLPMFKVTNTSNETKRFKEFDPAGGFRQAELAPGESGDFDIDPNQSAFVRGGLDVTASQAPTAKRPAKAAPKRGKPAPKAKTAQPKIKANEPEQNATGSSGASPADDTAEFNP